MAMNNCSNKCLCKKCAKVTKNCAECSISVDKTKECLNEGIKECNKFKPEEN